jgi:hypothetical protein
MGDRLTAEEDAMLRRLDALAGLGVLSGSAKAVYDELRARDRRAVIRPPVDVVIPQPREALDAGPVVSRR